MQTRPAQQGHSADRKNRRSLCSLSVLRRLMVAVMAHKPAPATLLLVTLVAQVSIAASEHEMSVGAQKEQICSASTVDIVGKFLGIDGFRLELTGNAPRVIVAAACKKNPAMPQITIAAVAFDDGKDDAKAMVVALVDESARRVIASTRGEIDEDAGMRVDSGSLWIDTAPYTLAPGVRAFGVDLTSGYIPHCGDGGSGADRTLYVQEGKNLRPIFGLTMSYWRFVKGGNPRCMASDQANDDIVIENTDVSIGLASTITNGYRDLVVTATSSEDGGQRTEKKPFRYKVRYDGREFRSQGLTESFDKWNH